MVTKINIIRAFNLIPEHFPVMLDNIRNIRNDFAHNLKIDSFNDANKSEKLPGHIDEMRRLWNKFQDDMCYWKIDKPLRLMFKDIWRVCIEGLRGFESNIRLFRQETEKKEFINHLSKVIYWTKKQTGRIWKGVSIKNVYTLDKINTTAKSGLPKAEVTW